jgi:hypothetical protein
MRKRAILAAAAMICTAMVIGGGSPAQASVAPATCYNQTLQDVGVTGVFDICPNTIPAHSVLVDITDTAEDNRCAMGEVTWKTSSNVTLTTEVSPHRACPKGNRQRWSSTAPPGGYYLYIRVFTVRASG